MWLNLKVSGVNICLLLPEGAALYTLSPEGSGARLVVFFKRRGESYAETERRAADLAGAAEVHLIRTVAQPLFLAGFGVPDEVGDVLELGIQVNEGSPHLVVPTEGVFHALTSPFLETHERFDLLAPILKRSDWQSSERELLASASS